MPDSERFQFFIVSAKLPLTLTLSQRERGLIAWNGRDTPTCDTELNSDSETDQKPLTLALSPRERGLIAVFGRGTPTCNSALNSGFEKPKNRLPLPRERAGVRGENTTKTKAKRAVLFTTQ